MALRYVLAFGLLISLFTVSSAHSAFGNCVKPPRPQIPESFPTETEVQLLANDVEAFIQNSQAYTACLVDYGRANKANLSKQEKQALRAEYDASLARLKRAADRWNSAYSKYLERTNGRG